MAKVLEKVVDTIQGLGDDKKLEIHSQAEVTRYVSRAHAHFFTPQRLRPPFPLAAPWEKRSLRLPTSSPGVFFPPSRTRIARRRARTVVPLAPSPRLTA
jgi:hypothetical protein